MTGDNLAISDSTSATKGDATIAMADTQSSTLGGDLLSRKSVSQSTHGSRATHLKHASHGTSAGKDQTAKQVRTDPAPPRFTSYSAYKRSSDQYWQRVDEAKHTHHLLAEFPPVFVRPEAPTASPPPDIDLENAQGTLPTLHDMKTASKQLSRLAFGDNKQPFFDLGPVDETEFKRRYTEEAVRLGQQNGFDKKEVQTIVQGIYSFEDGGWGTHDTLSGMPSALVADDAPGQTKIADLRDNYHPKSTGVGYNQLLRATTMLNLDTHGDDIVASLKFDALNDPKRHDLLLAKADLVQHLKAAMDKELRSLGHRLGGKHASDYLTADGNATDLLYHTFAGSKANTSLGLPASEMSNAIHALNLDEDIGPIMQAQELSGLLSFAHDHNFAQLLAQEVTKTTARAAAYDALPDDKKAKAIGELFALLHPADISASSTIPITDQDLSSLRAKILGLKAGPDESVDRQNLTNGEYALLNLGILTLKRVGEQTGPLSPDASLLLDKLTNSYRGGITVESLIPAAVELVNLAGPGAASAMLQPANDTYPTTNFFTRKGYYANGITNGRSAGELLMQIDRIMHGLNRDPNKPGQAQFEKIFQE